MDRWRVRQVVNLVNGSTLLGLAVARLGSARVAAGPRHLLIATGYRLPLPVARAFTLGNVICTRYQPGWLEAHPRLLAHEERHTWQYVACLGLPMLPLYAVASGWSWLRTGDVALGNAFERLAGLDDGGYGGRRGWRPLSGRALRRRRPEPAA